MHLKEKGYLDEIMLMATQTQNDMLNNQTCWVSYFDNMENNKNNLELKMKSSNKAIMDLEKKHEDLQRYESELQLHEMTYISFKQEIYMITKSMDDEVGLSPAENQKLEIFKSILDFHEKAIASMRYEIKNLLFHLKGQTQEQCKDLEHVHKLLEDRDKSFIQNIKYISVLKHDLDAQMESNTDLKNELNTTKTQKELLEEQAIKSSNKIKDLEIMLDTYKSNMLHEIENIKKTQAKKDSWNTEKITEKFKSLQVQMVDMLKDKNNLEQFLKAEIETIKKEKEVLKVNASQSMEKANEFERTVFILKSKLQSMEQGEGNTIAVGEEKFESGFINPFDSVDSQARMDENSSNEDITIISKWIKSVESSSTSDDGSESIPSRPLVVPKDAGKLKSHVKELRKLLTSSNAALNNKEKEHKEVVDSLSARIGSLEKALHLKNQTIEQLQSQKCLDDKNTLILNNEESVSLLDEQETQVDWHENRNKIKYLENALTTQEENNSLLKNRIIKLMNEDKEIRPQLDSVRALTNENTTKDIERGDVILSLRQTLERKNNELESFQKQMDEINQILKQRETQLKLIDLERSQLVQKLEKCQKLFIEEKKVTSCLSKEIQDLEVRHSEDMDRERCLNAAISTCKNEIENLLSGKLRVEEELKLQKRESQKAIQQFKKKNEDLATLEKDVAFYETAAARFEEEAKSLSKELKKTEGDFTIGINKSNEKNAHLENVLATQKKNNALLKKMLKKFISNVETHRQELNAFRKEAKEINARDAEHKDRIKTLTQRLEQKENEVKSYQRLLEESKAYISGLNKAQFSRDDDDESLVLKLQAQSQDQSSTISALIEKVDTKEGYITQLREELKSVTSELRKSQEESRRKENKIEEVESGIKSMTVELTSLTQEEEDTKSIMNDLHRKIAKITSLLEESSRSEEDTKRKADAALNAEITIRSQVELLKQEVSHKENESKKLFNTMQRDLMKKNHELLLKKNLLMEEITSLKLSQTIRDEAIQQLQSNLFSSSESLRQKEQKFHSFVECKVEMEEIMLAEIAMVSMLTIKSEIQIQLNKSTISTKECAVKSLQDRVDNLNKHIENDKKQIVELRTETRSLDNLKKNTAQVIKRLTSDCDELKLLLEEARAVNEESERKYVSMRRSYEKERKILKDRILAECRKRKRSDEVLQLKLFESERDEKKFKEEVANLSKSSDCLREEIQIEESIIRQYATQTNAEKARARVIQCQMKKMQETQEMLLLDRNEQIDVLQNALMIQNRIATEGVKSQSYVQNLKESIESLSIELSEMSTSKLNIETELRQQILSLIQINTIVEDELCREVRKYKKRKSSLEIALAAEKQTVCDLCEKVINLNRSFQDEISDSKMSNESLQKALDNTAKEKEILIETNTELKEIIHENSKSTKTLKEKSDGFEQLKSCSESQSCTILKLKEANHDLDNLIESYKSEIMNLKNEQKETQLALKQHKARSDQQVAMQQETIKCLQSMLNEVSSTKEEMIRKKDEKLKAMRNELNYAIDDLSSSKDALSRKKLEYEEQIENMENVISILQNEIKINMTSLEESKSVELELISDKNKCVNELTFIKQQMSNEIDGLRCQLDKNLAMIDDSNNSVIRFKEQLECATEEYHTKEAKLCEQIAHLEKVILDVESHHANEVERYKQNALLLENELSSQHKKISWLQTEHLQINNFFLKYYHNNDLQLRKSKIKLSDDLEHKILMLEEKMNGRLTTRKSDKSNDDMIENMKENIKITTNLFNTSQIIIDQLKSFVDKAESQISDDKRNLKEMEKTHHSAKERIARLEESERKLKDEVDELSITNHKLQSNLKRKVALIESLQLNMQQTQNNHSKQLKEYEGKVENILEKEKNVVMKDYECIIDKINNDRIQLQKEVSKNLSTIKDSNRELDKHKSDHAMLRENHYKLQKQFEELVDERSKRERGLKSKIKELEQTKRSLEISLQTSTEACKMENELQKSLALLDEANKSLSFFDKEDKKKEAKLEERKNRENELIKDLMDVAKQNKNAKRDLKSSEQKYHAIEKELVLQKQLVIELKSEIKKLREQQSILKSSTRDFEEEILKFKDRILKSKNHNNEMKQEIIHLQSKLRRAESFKSRKKAK